MSEFNNTPIDFPCPQCGFINTMSLGQIAELDSVFCRGCKARLYVENGEGPQDIKRVLNSLDSLSSSFEKNSSIKIKL
ncbi:MAG: hypothetical protein M1511_04060 [Deltaproteobacteria bacterium]|nr:hypothetical protein [Deltaproteobacteria bacterium]